MRYIAKLLKRMFIILGILLVIFIAVVAAFVNTQPQFGQQPKGADLERTKKSPNYAQDAFKNLIETKQGDFWAVVRTLPAFIWGTGGSPKQPLPTEFENEFSFEDSLCYVTWYGHSAFLIELDGKRILIDPMLGDMAAPTSFGSKRFTYVDPIPLEDLGQIDAVIISHDHYDHLDHPTIMSIKDQVGHFYTALGVGSHLKYWGVPEEQITELDWWEESALDGIRLVACPSRHFSGRAFTDANSTQWASWVIQGSKQNIYFSGDGGYGPHFTEIGERFGPFDFAMIECGQYNLAWHNIHMLPEESVQAGIDVQGKVVMPIHWGAFRLSVHTWTEPIERFTKKADELDINYVHPEIGKRFVVGEHFPRNRWWEN